MWNRLNAGLSGMFGDPNDPTEPGMVNPGKDARLALAAQLLGGTHSGSGFNANLAQALLAGHKARSMGQQQNQQAKQAKMEEEYRRAQMAGMGGKAGPNIGALSPEKYTPESIAKFQVTQNYGDLVPVATATSGQQSWAGNVNPGDWEPASIAEYAKTIDPTTGIGDFNKLKRIWAPPTVSFQSTPGLGSVVVDPGRRLGGGPITQITTPEQERDAAAKLKAAQEQAAKEAEARGVRNATFNSDIAKIDDEITRTNRLLAEFRNGKYQTGRVAGMLPNVRTAAQDLAREQGKDVISAISSATFGALSEGERSFLKELGVSESATEESNINMLTQRAEKLRTAKERLLKQGGADSGKLAPTGSTNVDALLEKYAPKAP